MNHREQIEAELLKNNLEFTYSEPNETLNHILPDVEIKFYPRYLYVNDNNYLLFYNIDSEPFAGDITEIREHFDNIDKLLQHLKGCDIQPKAIIITPKQEDFQVIFNLGLNNDFGVFHAEFEQPIIDLQVRDIYQTTCKLLPQTLEYLSTAQNLTGIIGTQIKQFSLNILATQPTGAVEDAQIQNLVNNVLKYDGRVAANTKNLEVLKTLERYVFSKVKRDHYYHSINTMLIGFILIDKIRSTLTSLFHDTCIDIEYLWVMTSLLHDIGYPVENEEDIICDLHDYDMNDPDDAATVKSKCKQNRLEIWTSLEHEIASLDSLYAHLVGGCAGIWIYDRFAHPTQPTSFKQALSISYVEKGYHGACGAIRIVHQINNNLRHIEDQQLRRFIYMHMLTAALSILFHDQNVRTIFSEFGIVNIPVKYLPFSGILTYIDVIQNDRRNKEGSLCYNDIFRNIDWEASKITATLDVTAIPPSMKLDILKELTEAIKYFIENGLKFKIPTSLQT